MLCEFNKNIIQSKEFCPEEVLIQIWKESKVTAEAIQSDQVLKVEKLPNIMLGKKGALQEILYSVF